jgi:hypothetical protein
LSFTAEYSWWLLVPSLLIASTSSWWLYKANPLKLEGNNAQFIYRILIGVRFATLFLLCLLLIGPLIKWLTSFTEKPVVAIVIDQSSSISQYRDAKWYENQLPAELDKLKLNLSADHEVHIYGFADRLQTEFDATYTGKSTNMAAALKEVGMRHADRNLSAIIIAGDGLYNQGTDPIDIAREMRMPIYTLLMGDTTSTPDLLIKQVKHNEVAFAGNNIMIQVDVAALLLEGASTTLSIEQEGNILATKVIGIGSNRYFESHRFTVPVGGEGLQLYKIRLSKAGVEENLTNNAYQVFVNVISNKQQVLIMAQSPHPDIGALRKSVEKNEGYTCNVMYVQDANIQKPDQYSLVILHQLPGWRGEAMALIEKCKNMGIPLMYVVGAQTGLNYLMQAETSLRIQYRNNMINETTPKLNESFGLFGISEEEKLGLAKMPPLIVPYSTTQIGADHEVLFTQQIGNVSTGQPLWYFLKNDNRRSAIIMGEGIWRWMLTDFKQSDQTHVPVLINKTLQYLAVRKDRSRFVVQMQPKFYENEPITIEAEKYNESYELTQDDEVSISITNQNKEKFNYTLVRTGQRYVLQLGLLPPGKYTYTATAINGTKKEEKTGTFNVLPLQLELLENTANAQLMNELAQITGARMLPIKQMQQLTNILAENEYVRPVSFSNTELLKWIDLKWLFWLIIFLLTLEWVVRRWNGTI